MWPDQTKTQELLLGARQGDDSAVNRLLDRHRQALRRMVQLRLDQKIQGRIDVSDIVQDVLVEANRRLPQYLENPVMSFHLWVRQIAKDRIIDAHRRHRVSAKRSVDREQSLAVPAASDRSTYDLVGQLHDPELTPAAAATRQEMAQLVEERARTAQRTGLRNHRDAALRAVVEHGSRRGAGPDRAGRQHAVSSRGPAPAGIAAQLPPLGRILRTGCRQVLRTNVVNTASELWPQPDDAASEHDQQLAGLLSELSDRVRRGESVDLETECRAHPELARELRELWGAVLVADAVGSVARTGGDDAGPEQVSETGVAPRRVGDYELLEELGRGGMGVVYLARQVNLNRQLAVKMILRGPLASQGDRERFLAEAQAAARLDHVGIVPVYQVGEEGGRMYFSMKYIKGPTLSDLLQAGPLPPQTAAQLLAKVCRAIDFAHQSGVLHRDLKPSNILIDEDGEPHVTDFGLAKRITDPHSMTHSGAVVGTPAYMSPEQAAGNRSVGPVSDVYSLGAILYHMLTGQPPFQAASPVDAVMKVIEQDPVPPRQLNRGVDRDLELIAVRCLQKPPDLRYDSAGALAADLEAFLNHEPIAARRGRFTQVISRWFRETHHATVLENWGLLWMWHSLALLVACLLTNILFWNGVENRWYYFYLWSRPGLGPGRPCSGPCGTDRDRSLSWNGRSPTCGRRRWSASLPSFHWKRISDCPP